MTASAEMSRVFDVPVEELPAAVDEALRDIGAKSIRWTRRQVTASMRWSLWSYGERLTVEVDRLGEVWIRSECAMPFQILDWGKNYRNCKALIKAIARRLELG